jgi:hypothetical protein
MSVRTPILIVFASSFAMAGPHRTAAASTAGISLMGRIYFLQLIEIM